MKLIKILKYKSETEYDLFLTKIYSWVYCFLKIIDNSRYGNYSNKIFYTLFNCSKHSRKRERTSKILFNISEIFRNIHTNKDANDISMFRKENIDV